MKALKVLSLIVGLLLMLFSGGCALLVLGAIVSEGVSAGNLQELFSVLLEVLVFAAPGFGLGYLLFYLGRSRKKERAKPVTDDD
ncbi:MAG TPA: hypothetical protein VJS40_04095 [Aestuariivirgaceae bacterium]|nr:hypothetical protein [Aestuariivirgaceae bacterium]